jgi:hypothetical protein
MSKHTENYSCRCLSCRAKLAASGSANALDRALGYLNAALTELDQAHANVTTSKMLHSADEADLYFELSKALTAEGPRRVISLSERIRSLRDRRAARAGFSFDE